MIFSSSSKDFWYEAQTSALTYYIEADGNPVYWGKAVSSTGNARIDIGRRVSDYLDTEMPDFRNYNGVIVPHPNQMRVFNLRDEDGVLLESYTVLLDADGGWTGEYGAITSPVNGHADMRQKIFWTTAEERSEGYPSNTDGADYRFTIILGEYGVFPSSGGVINIPYTANTSFYVGDACDWLTVQKVGENTGYLVATASGNTAVEERCCKVRLSKYFPDNNETVNYYFTICQDMGFPQPVIGAPELTDIWINSEAYLESGTKWLDKKTDGSSHRGRYNIYRNFVAIDDYGFQPTVIDTPTHKILRFGSPLMSFDRVKFSNKIKNLYWIVFPPSFQSTDDHNVNNNGPGVDCTVVPNSLADSMAVGRNDEITAVTFTMNEEWGRWYALKYPQYNPTKGLLQIAMVDFYNSRALKAVNFNPAVLKQIRRLTFAQCGFTDLYIPDGVELLDGRCFAGCPNLVNVSIPNTIREVGRRNNNYNDYGEVFYNCDSLTEITYRGTVEQWNQIPKNNYIGRTGLVIHCTDGDVVNP